MEYVTITKDNIDDEHICCAISDKKSVEGYAAKKAWLKEQLDKGYTFNKLNVRGKVFMEYCPSEIAYLPVKADNYMVINCFWISGKYKGSGHGKELLKRCIEDCKKQDKAGIVVLCSDKKRPFMSDKKFFLKQGFEVCDQTKPYFELLYMPLQENVEKPVFRDTVKEGECQDNGGFTVFYSHQCPYMSYYVNLQKKVADEHHIPYEAILLDSKEKAMDNPSPFTIYSLFYKGKFITQELMAEKKFTKTIETLCEA
ncbi:YoaP domain-containing protein [Vallitalea pronyensis]|uniref:YoaP domain-containing protein n=1 Tax=Vallitalea pronyensis TaxID=1348613 RepID=A0A8J8MK35_9FIRM|nr:N-acetyltransferase [Vallitalea pronyensis]QUI23120.1 YoaP domain-containing protein [Vallitalea pronyensis]